MEIKNEKYFSSKKGQTFPFVKISFFKKIWICSILCSCVAFNSIVMKIRLFRLRRGLVPILLHQKFGYWGVGHTRLDFR